MLKKKFKIKAAVLIKQKKNLQILDLTLPEKLEQGQLLIKIKTAAICGAQIGEIEGIKGKDKWIPHCLGHEGYGIVVKKNKSVKKVNINDEVILHWRKSDGKNAKPPIYKSKIGNINAGQITTFQNYAIISENRVTRVKNFKKYSKVAPLLGCAFPTAWGILNKETRFNIHKKILVFGAGGIGMTVAALAKIQKSKNVILIDKGKKKSKYTKRLNLTLSNMRKIKKIKFDIVVETTGNIDNMEKGFNQLNKNGRLILVGQPKINSILRIKNPLRLFNPPADNIKILSSDGGKFNPKHDMNKLSLIVKNNFSYLKKLVSHQINIININNAIKLIKNGNAARIIIGY